MDNEKINELLKQYGKKVCEFRLSNSSTRSKAYLLATENDYPTIAIGYIGGKCFSREEIDKVHDTNRSCTIYKTKQKLISILNSLDKGIIADKKEADSFIKGLLGNKYPAVNGCKIAFEKSNSSSKLEITLEKSC